MESRTKRIVLTVIALFLLVGCIFFLVYAAKYASAVLFEIEEGTNVETTEEVIATETSETSKATVLMPDVKDWNYLNAQDKLKEFFNQNSLDIKIVIEWCENTDPDKGFYIQSSTPEAGEPLTDVKEIVLIVCEGYTLPETTETTPEETTATETTKATEPSKTKETTKATEATPETTKDEPAKALQKTVTMPDVSGMNYKDAQKELEKFFKDNGLNITVSVGWGHNSNPDNNLKVICTTPSAGETIDSSTEVVIMMVYEGYNPPINN
jgi:beta-lactam-binding protein with PASTA domain